MLKVSNKMKVIDNFLDDEYFNKLAHQICYATSSFGSEFPWYYVQSRNSFTNTMLFFFTHYIYRATQEGEADYLPSNSIYNLIQPFVKKVKVIENESEMTESWMIRANLYPNTEKLQEHSMHRDADFSHNSAILYLNTCDGYTKMVDGTKINSVANRLALFDGSELHCSTTTTNVAGRFVLIVNYCSIQKTQHNTLSLL
jgi:hypothetical protein